MNEVREQRRTRGESGFVGGAEVLPFGVLVFIGAIVLAVNGWSVVQVKGILDSAGRDYLRAYTESETRSSALASADDVARTSLRKRLGESLQVEISPPGSDFGPCRLATVQMSVEVPALNIPFVGDLAHRTVRSTQSELIDPYAPNEAAAIGLEGTPCE